MPANCWITSPRMMQLSALRTTTNPLASAPARAPLSTMTGVLDESRLRGASIVTVSVIAGKAEVKLMFWTPLAAMAKSMVSAPGVVFAVAIAARSDPEPALLVFVTWMTAGARRSSSPSTRGQNVRRGMLQSLLVGNGVVKLTEADSSSQVSAVRNELGEIPMQRVDSHDRYGQQYLFRIGAPPPIAADVCSPTRRSTGPIPRLARTGEFLPLFDIGESETQTDDRESSPSS